MMPIHFATMAGAAGLLAIGCSRLIDEPETKSPALPLPVRVTEVMLSPIPVFATVVGTTAPYATSTPSTRIMGRITSAAFQAGDRVKAGQVLVQVEDADLAARRRQAQAALDAAQAVMFNGERTLKRMRNLYKEQAVPRQQLDDAQTSVAQARAGVDGAQQGIREVEAQLRYARVAAPFAGVVVRKQADEGDMASPGMPLFTIERQDSLKVDTIIGERDRDHVRVGDEVEVDISSMGHLVRGRISAVVPAADPASRTFRVEVVVANPGGALHTGMFARVRVRKDPRLALLIPEAAVFERGQLTGVHVVVDGRATLRWIRLGTRQSGGRVEVLAGVNAGDRIVLSTPEPFIEGRFVEVDGHG